jgi:predicted nucleotidyltransferase
MRQLDATSNIECATLAETLGGVLCSDEFRASLIAAYLIGSWSTGEASRQRGTSDIDILLVMHDSIDELACASVKAQIRSRIHDEPVVGEITLGLRCRYGPELARFTRYLALQGYHSTHAVSLVTPVDKTFELPGFSTQVLSREELLCVLAEWLWAEVRARALSQDDDLAIQFAHAKNLLAYLNLALISDGVFLPTHMERTTYWQHRNPEIDRELLEDALMLKLGTAECISITVRMRKLLSELRSIAYQSMQGSKCDANNVRSCFKTRHASRFNSR